MDETNEVRSAQFGKFMMEFIGTAILLFTIQVTVGQGNDMAPIAIGIVLVTIIYAGGPISGAHYNPAVSAAVALRGKMCKKEMLIYWIFQLGGGLLGAFLGGFIGGNTFSGVAIGSGSTFLQAFLAEAIFTFLLCFVVLAVATNSEVDGNHYYGAAIGFVVMAGAITVGPISGGVFNPAVAWGLALSEGIYSGTFEISYAIGVTIANLLGSLIAAICFYLVAPRECDSTTTGSLYSLLPEGSVATID